MRHSGPSFKMPFLVPGDPEHLLFATKAELFYIQISIFLWDEVSIYSDGGLRGGREGGGRRAGGYMFISKAGKPWSPTGKVGMNQAGPQE